MSPHLHNAVDRIKSRGMLALCVLFTIAIVSLLVLVTGYLISIGASALSVDFFTQTPTGNATGDIGGMKQSIAGTAVLVTLASLFGIPVGMLSGVYLAEYDAGSWFATPVRFIADVLAGVPSIVVGILGYELLVVPFSSGELMGIPIPGLMKLGIHYNGWAGTLALAFIMIPIVTRTTEEMLRLVPNSYREASIALGATKARTILRVVVPSATGSIVTGVMLAIARVAGETAPLLFTALGSRYMRVFHPSWPYLRLSEVAEPFPSLTKQIYDYMAGSPDQNRQAWAGILVLITLIFVLNIAIRFFTRSKMRVAA